LIATIALGDSNTVSMPCFHVEDEATPALTTFSGEPGLTDNSNTGQNQNSAKHLRDCSPERREIGLSIAQMTG